MIMVKGGVYLAGLPYSIDNTRLLMRALYYAARIRKGFFNKWHIVATQLLRFMPTQLRASMPLSIPLSRATTTVYDMVKWGY